MATFETRNVHSAIGNGKICRFHEKEHIVNQSFHNTRSSSQNMEAQRVKNGKSTKKKSKIKFFFKNVFAIWLLPVLPVLIFTIAIFWFFA